MRTTDRVYQILLIEDTDANLVKGSEEALGLPLGVQGG